MSEEHKGPFSDRIGDNPDKSKGTDQDVPDELKKVFKEIERVEDRYDMITERVGNPNDSLASTVRKVLNRGTTEGAAFKRALKDLRMQISKTLGEI